MSREVSMIYGVTFLMDPPDQAIHFVPAGAVKMLVYSADGARFWESDQVPSGGVVNSPGLVRAAEMGKYKLDLAVRAMFPQYRSAVRAQDPGAAA